MNYGTGTRDALAVNGAHDDKKGSSDSAAALPELLFATTTKSYGLYKLVMFPTEACSRQQKAIGQRLAEQLRQLKLKKAGSAGNEHVTCGGTPNPHVSLLKITSVVFKCVVAVACLLACLLC